MADGYDALHQGDDLPSLIMDNNGLVDSALGIQPSANPPTMIRICGYMWYKVVPSNFKVG